MTKYLPYDNEINYFRTCVDFEQQEAKKNGETYDPEIMMQINSRLGQNKRCHTDGGPIMIKNMNLENDEQNRYWYNWNNVNMRKLNRKTICSFKDMNAEYLKLNSKVQDEDIWAFITLGFDDEKIAGLAYDLHLKQIEKICYTISHLCYAKGAIKSIQYVIEKHRQTGIHHHCHFLFRFHKKVPPSTMINKIFAAKGVAEYCRDKHFIDYIGPQKVGGKPCAPLTTYCKYILGDKKEEKLLFVCQDREWREYYKLNHLYIVE